MTDIALIIISECIEDLEDRASVSSEAMATAHKSGMNKILEVRKKAKTTLGDKFDIREFHDVVLKNGAVPLNILEEMVDEWVERK